MKHSHKNLWSAVSIFFGAVVIAAVIYPLVIPSVIVDKKTPEISTVKQIALAFIMYAADSDDRLPLGKQWDEKLLSGHYVKSSSLFNELEPRRCAMNVFLGGAIVTGIDQPENTILTFVSTSSRNDAAGGYELLAEIPKSNRAVVGFLDGHVRASKRTEFSKSLWVPKDKIRIPAAR